VIPLHIEFQDGWEGDRVAVRLDGALSAELEPRTRMQTGFAAAEVIEAEPGAHVVEIDVADAEVVAQHPLDLQAETWLGVSRSPSGTISFREQQTLFGYV
jgi:hypothetical protein